MKQPDDTYYDILDIPKDASQQDISSSYRKLAKMLHPDVCDSPDAEELFKALNEAYQTLRDPKKRTEYDASIGHTQTSPYNAYHHGERRYRHPRTWYYSNRQYRAGKTEPPAREVRKEVSRYSLPRRFQVILFYLSLFMAIVIIVELFLLPWIEGANATGARSAFLEGNTWVEEEEYQKAIESYQKAASILPSFSEAWRAKGLAEVKKAEELSKLGKPDGHVYYRDAIASFSRVSGQTTNDITVKKALATAYLGNGDEKKALDTLSSIQATSGSDPEVHALMQKIRFHMNTPGGAG
jgi:curved DNA-binding protein CbpA